MQGKLGEYQAWLRDAFDAPKTKAQLIVTLVSMAAVVGSIFHIAFTVENPETVQDYVTTIDGIEWAFTVFFTVEIALRIFAKPNPKDYALTRFGLIDILAVAPTWLSLIFPGLPNLNWLRALRLIRLLQIVEVLRKTPGATASGYGLLLQLAPFMAYAFILKTIVVVLEGAGLWWQISGLELVISVIGFAIGVLLSTRLGTVQARLYDFENQVANLAASLRIVRDNVAEPLLVKRFTRNLVRFSQGECDAEVPRRDLDRIAAAGPGSVGPPIWINFNQGAQFVLERFSRSVNSEYTRVLRNVIVIYIVAVLLVIPGLTGLLSAALVVYVLGGMFMLVRNMEIPYEPGEGSLINANIEPLLRVDREHGDIAVEDADPAADDATSEEGEPAPLPG